MEISNAKIAFICGSIVVLGVCVFVPVVSFGVGCGFVGGYLLCGWWLRVSDQRRNKDRAKKEKEYEKLREELFGAK